MDLKTTTRPRRNVSIFGRIVPFLPPRPPGQPLRVAEVGPGLAVKYLGRLTASDQPLWDFFRRLESGLRRLPMPDVFFENYETREIIEALAGIPFELTLVDINPKVVRVVRRNLPQHPIRSALANLGEPHPAALAPLVGTFDLVVALAVAGRVRGASDTAAANIAGLAGPGGIVIGDGDFSGAAWAPVGDGVPAFRRLAAGAAR